VSASSRLLAAALLAACASRGEFGSTWSAADEADPAGWLDGRAVTYDEVARHLRSKDPELFARALEGVLLERIARSDAAREGVTVPAPLLSRETTRRVREWEAHLQEASRAETGRPTDPAAWLAQAAGLGLDEFRALVRRHTEVELLQDRLLRLEQLRAARVEASILVVDSEESARDLAERARRGEEFAALAKQHSVHATKEAGGRFGYPILRDDVLEPAIGDALLRAKPGEVLGPFAAPSAGKVFHQIYRVDASLAGRDAAFRDVEAEIARGLEERPVAVGEYERWRRRALLRHGFEPGPPPRQDS